MADPVDTLRVLIADDHPVVRRGMSALLSSLDGVEVVGEVSTGEQAVREAQILHPDVVVMDVQMPDMDGIEATRRLSVAVPGSAVLILTMFEDDDTVYAAMRAGARGYLLKGASQEDILTALRSVQAGQLVIGPGVAERLMGFLNTPQSPGVVFPDLTPREREILGLLAEGVSNSAIAHRLALAPKTVGNHISAVFAKLRVSTRAEAIVRARDGGLGRGSGGPGGWG